MTIFLRVLLRLHHTCLHYSRYLSTCSLSTLNPQASRPSSSSLDPCLLATNRTSTTTLPNSGTTYCLLILGPLPRHFHFHLHTLTSPNTSTHFAERIITGAKNGVADVVVLSSRGYTTPSFASRSPAQVLDVSVTGCGRAWYTWVSGAATFAPTRVSMHLPKPIWEPHLQSTS